MNDVVYNIASFQVMRNPVAWRWSHARHHTDTYIVGRDPEIAFMRPPAVVKLGLAFIGVQARLGIDGHPAAAGGGQALRRREGLYPRERALEGDPRRADPHRDLCRHHRRALAFRSWIPLMVIGLPRIYGAWHMVMSGLLQHGGLADNVTDHRLNSRTVYMNPISRFIYWNMNYHIEHHMFPMVPYHALPRLHELVKADYPPPNSSILDGYSRDVPGGEAPAHRPGILHPPRAAAGGQALPRRVPQRLHHPLTGRAMRKKPTVADLRALKGQGQRTMLRVMTLEEAAAAEAAGIDIVSVPAELVTHPEYRQRRPDALLDDRPDASRGGHPRRLPALGLRGDERGRRRGLLLGQPRHGRACRARAYPGGRPCRAGAQPRHLDRRLQGGGQDRRAGAWRSTTNAGPTRRPAPSRSRSRWCRSRSRRAISARLKLLLWSMGAGAGCDAQYLFACDILGAHREHMPRHSKVYRDFAAEYDRLQAERVAAFREFVADVGTGAYPEERHLVHMTADDLAAFQKALSAPGA